MSRLKLGKYSKSELYGLPDGVHKIEKNFYLRVRANGKYRTFFFRYVDKDGQTRDCNIGSLRKITFTEAKQKVYFLRTVLNISNLSSPLSSQMGVKFEDFAMSTIDTLASVKLWKNPEQKKSWISSIRTYALPKIGEKFVEEVTRNDILEILKPIWIEKTMTATRLRGRLEKIFLYAINEGIYVGKNPAVWKGNLEMYLPPVDKCTQRSHFKSLSFEQLLQIIPILYESKMPGCACLLFGILTATRANEFTHAHWKEIDFKNKVWNCPPGRRKDGKKECFRVPLSNQALTLLKKLKGVSTGEFVFTKDQKQPLRKETPLKVLKETLKLDCTMRGMRSTFRDWCIESGVREVVAEKSLMHSTGNEVVSAYQRSDLLEERREVLQKWADALFSVLNEVQKKADS